MVGPSDARNDHSPIETNAPVDATPVDLVDAGDPGDGDPGDEVPADADSPVDLAPEVLPLEEGRPCDGADQCASGVCAQGVCCRSACSGICMACNLGASSGQCTPVPAGEDPGESCAPEAPVSCGLDGTCNGMGACRRYPAGAECAAGKCTGATEYAASTCDGNGSCLPGMMRTCASGMCMGSSCASPCTKSTECQSGFFCDKGKCALKRAIATTCGAAEQCATGFCVDGLCCNSECGEKCFACNVAATPGMCKPVPSGQDPRAQCPGEAASTCGRAGGCNGAGGCRLHPVNTICGASTCSVTTETPARTCDGLGVCRPPGAPRDCSPYLCGGQACAASCVDSSSCAPGFSCQTNVCARIPGLALYWRFEEASGTTAIDSSGNGRNGVYIGSSGTPAPSTDIPTLMHPNLRSRAFNKSNRHAAQTTSSALQPANDFTLSLWYRATKVDSAASASDISSGWNAYLLRLRAGTVDWTKRTGDSSYVQCTGNAPSSLDGAWHHLAGVASRSSGVKLYFDGAEICSMNQKSDLAYSASADGFFVGRHGDGQDQWDFDGNVDEVRFYTRPLTAAEVLVLSQGRNN